MKNFIDFMEIVGKLKHLKRTGWCMRAIENAETVASHSWRMAVMALTKQQEITALGCDVNKVVEMCLLHDVSEAVVGDIVPEEHQRGEVKISKSQKRQMELEAIDKLSNEYGFAKLKNLFEEYENLQTIEARVVKDLDKLDVILQAYEYIKKYGKDKNLQEFMEYNFSDIKLEMFIDEAKEIKKRQEEFLDEE